MLPKSVKVGHTDYQISTVKDLKSSSGEELYGSCDRGSFKIFLDESVLYEHLQAEVLLHEVLHAIWINADLGKRETEEKVITLLSRGLVALFRDNPEFIQYIKRTTK